jgi:hypothetical protein
VCAQNNTTRSEELLTLKYYGKKAKLPKMKWFGTIIMTEEKKVNGDTGRTSLAGQ